MRMSMNRVRLHLVTRNAAPTKERPAMHGLTVTPWQGETRHAALELEQYRAVKEAIEGMAPNSLTYDGFHPWPPDTLKGHGHGKFYWQQARPPGTSPGGYFHLDALPEAAAAIIREAIGG
jgi:hypothetical protein